MALAFMLAACASTAAGCGASQASSPPALKLQREDLVLVTRALQRVEGSVEREVTAAKRAWPLVVNGLPSDIAELRAEPIAAAASSAASITLPALFEEAHAAGLTGPGAQLAGLFRNYTALASRGWSLIDASVTVIERGTPGDARFARENVALYIESVYDGHFALAQIGKRLLAGYRKLGGAAAFSAALSSEEVDRLAEAYSEATDRLHPHAGVRLGS